MDGRLITAKEVAEDLACSMQHAYKIVRKLNEELERDGLHHDARERPTAAITKRGSSARSDEIDLSRAGDAGPATSVRKDAKRGTWLVKLPLHQPTTARAIDSTKRGFKTKTEALAWERDFLANEARSTSMTFEQFVKVYAEDVRPRLRETTWRSKEYMINEKLIPFFGKMRVVISPPVRSWTGRTPSSKQRTRTARSTPRPTSGPWRTSSPPFSTMP